MRRLIMVVFSLFGALALAVIAGRSGSYHSSMTPRILSDWVGSPDGKLSASLVVDKTTFSTGEDIFVRCAVRNDTDGPLTILRPFGDPFYAHSTGLCVLGPNGEVRYSGPMKEYVLGTGSFYELRGQTIIDERLELPKNRLPGLGASGLYKIQYIYQSSGYPKSPKPRNLWEGRILTRPVHILVVEKEPDN
jgi:hypothetical protein